MKNVLKLDKAYYAGIDLHGRRQYVCVMNKAGDIQVHRQLPNDFGQLLGILKPYLPSLAVGVESTYNWYWLGDACQAAGIPFYLGHALYMKAIQVNKHKNDRIDSKIIADLMRCGMFPLAYVYPAEMRATRDLLRRRRYFVQLRSGCYAHVQNTCTQQAILDVKSVDVKRKSDRRQLCQRFDHPDIQMSAACDFDMIEACDAMIAQIETQTLSQARHHNEKHLDSLMRIPGVGQILAMTTLYEMHRANRFRTVQDFCSYARVVKVERSSDGKPTKDGNPNIGNPYLKC